MDTLSKNRNSEHASAARTEGDRQPKICKIVSETLKTSTFDTFSIDFPSKNTSFPNIPKPFPTLLEHQNTHFFTSYPPIQHPKTLHPQTSQKRSEHPNTIKNINYQNSSPSLLYRSPRPSLPVGRRAPRRGEATRRKMAPQTSQNHGTLTTLELRVVLLFKSFTPQKLLHPSPQDLVLKFYTPKSFTTLYPRFT